MISIEVPSSAYAVSEVVLSDVVYQFVWKYNEFDSRWRIDIYHDNEPIVLGVKVIEWVPLLSWAKIHDKFTHGEIFCWRMQDDGREATFDNIGVDKPYELLYFNIEELIEIANA